MKKGDPIIVNQLKRIDDLQGIITKLRKANKKQLAIIKKLKVRQFKIDGLIEDLKYI